MYFNKQVHVVTFRFERAIKSVELFSYCRADPTKHMCVVASHSDISSSHVRWTYSAHSSTEKYFNTTGNTISTL